MCFKSAASNRILTVVFPGLLFGARRGRGSRRPCPGDEGCGLLFRTSRSRERASSHEAKAAGFEIVQTFYDAAVSGADPVDDRPGFTEMLERLLSNGARTILVESPDRFARDLMVQLAGHDMLKAKGGHPHRGVGPHVLPRGHPDRCPGAPGPRRRRAV